MDGKSGYLVPERNVDTLTEKLEFLVSNPSIWEKMGEERRKYVEKNYNITQDRLKDWKRYIYAGKKEMKRQVYPRGS